MTHIHQIVSALLFLALCGCGVAAESAQAVDTENSGSPYRSIVTSQLRGSDLPKDVSQTREPCPLPSPPEPEIVDEDGDSVPADIDCNDYNPSTYPGAYELCDYQDNDCNGETDEYWKILYGDIMGKHCTAQAPNGCISEGVWGCDFSQDALACNAPPVEPTTEHCNGEDDDCNGITDTDSWPELGALCISTKDGCTRVGVWACDNYMLDSYCTAEDKSTAPENCDPDGGG